MTKPRQPQCGDRVALVETVPTNAEMKRYRHGTVTSVGHHGSEVRLDDSPEKPPVWLRNTKSFVFVVHEGPGVASMYSRDRPVNEKEEKVAEPKIEKRPKADPLAAMEAAGVDLLDVYEALGRKLAPRLRQEYLDACEARDSASAKLSTARGMVEKAQEEYRAAEALAGEAQEELDHAEAAVAAKKARMDSVKE